LLTVVCIVLGVVAVAFAVLWLIARFRLAKYRRSRANDDRRRVELELANAEQAAKLELIRELHEVTVTDLGTLVGHAEGAKYAIKADPSAAGRIASVIEDAARAILADVRRLLTLVREAEALGAADPGLQSIDELYDVMTQSGLEIRVLETGTPFELKAGPQLAVYRIVHGALENALAHGGPGTNVTVAFTWTGDSLSISIEDDGVLAAERRGESSDAVVALAGEGRTLDELRERTAVYGGVFSAGAVPGKGFAVSVAFPRIRYNNGLHSVKLKGSNAPE
jgi:signal transduction histidine kinase